MGVGNYYTSKQGVTVTDEASIEGLNQMELFSTFLKATFTSRANGEFFTREMDTAKNNSVPFQLQFQKFSTKHRYALKPFCRAVPKTEYRIHAHVGLYS